MFGFQLIPLSLFDVVWRSHYINTLKQELSGTNAYKETSEEEKSVVYSHWSFLLRSRNNKTSFLRYIVYLRFIKTNKQKTYITRFIANKSSNATTELSKFSLLLNLM